MASKRGGKGSIFKRAVWLVVAVVAIVFAVEGGEFGTVDLFRNRRDMTRLQYANDSLQRVLSKLRAYKDSLERDPSVQERIAREQFGMVRGDKELIYRFTDSVRTRRSP
jgi:cell division protein FtsB